MWRGAKRQVAASSLRKAHGVENPKPGPVKDVFTTLTTRFAMLNSAEKIFIAAAAHAAHRGLHEQKVSSQRYHALEGWTRSGRTRILRAPLPGFFSEPAPSRSGHFPGVAAPVISDRFEGRCSTAYHLEIPATPPSPPRGLVWQYRSPYEFDVVP